MFVLIIAAIALILIFTPSRFRKIAFTVVGAVFLIFLAIVLINRRPPPESPPMAAVENNITSTGSRRFDFDKYEQEKKDKEDPQAKTRIAVSEVRFGQVEAIPGLEPGTIQSVHARLYNDSHEFTLTDYSYYLTVQDCLPAKSTEKADDRCTTVYDQRDSASLAVPANQARDVVISISKNPASFAPPFKLLGTPRIELRPTDTRAYQP